MRALRTAEELELDSLQKELEALTVENRALKAKVSELGRKLFDEKSHFQSCGALIVSLWRNMTK